MRCRRTDDRSGDPFEALGDPNRREILRLLGEGDKAVTELADAMPISRPGRLAPPAAAAAGRAGDRAGPRAPVGSTTSTSRGSRRSRPISSGCGATPRPRFRLLADNTDDRSGPVTEPLLPLLRGGLPARPGLRPVDRADRHVVAVRPHGDRRTDLTVVSSPGSAAGSSSGRRTGDEHDWGEVTVWEPPARLAYLWHLRRDRADATEVSVRFAPRATAAPGWRSSTPAGSAWAPTAEAWRGRNRAGWRTLLPHYVAARRGATRDPTARPRHDHRGGPAMTTAPRTIPGS